MLGTGISTSQTAYVNRGIGQSGHKPVSILVACLEVSRCFLTVTATTTEAILMLPPPTARRSGIASRTNGRI